MSEQWGYTLYYSDPQLKLTKPHIKFICSIVIQLRALPSQIAFAFVLKLHNVKKHIS